MKKLLLCLSFLPFLGLAQTTNTAQIQNQMQAAQSFFTTNRSSYLPLYRTSEREMDGSRFFNEAYLPGELWAKDGRHFKDEYVYKFDELDNTVQIKDKNGLEIQLLRVDINACMIDLGIYQTLFFYAPVPDEPQTYRLFQLLHRSETFQLIKLPHKRIRTRPKGMMNDSDFKDTYVSEPSFYLRITKGEFVKIKLKKADILKAIPDKQGTLELLFDQKEFKGKLDEAKLVALLMELEKKSE